MVFFIWTINYQPHVHGRAKEHQLMFKVVGSRTPPLDLISSARYPMVKSSQSVLALIHNVLRSLIPYEPGDQFSNCELAARHIELSLGSRMQTRTRLRLRRLRILRICLKFIENFMKAEIEFAGCDMSQCQAVSKPCVSREVAVYVCILVALQISAKPCRCQCCRFKTQKHKDWSSQWSSCISVSILWQLREKAIQVLLSKPCDLSSNLGRCFFWYVRYDQCNQQCDPCGPRTSHHNQAALGEPSPGRVLVEDIKKTDFGPCYRCTWNHTNRTAWYDVHGTYLR